ncbi:hypothetical protein MNEG_2394, partial [Monoraphidium neglectum]
GRRLPRRLQVRAAQAGPHPPPAPGRQGRVRLRGHSSDRGQRHAVRRRQDHPDRRRGGRALRRGAGDARPQGLVVRHWRVI